MLLAALSIFFDVLLFLGGNSLSLKCLWWDTICEQNGSEEPEALLKGSTEKEEGGDDLWRGTQGEEVADGGGQVSVCSWFSQASIPPVPSRRLPVKQSACVSRVRARTPPELGWKPRAKQSCRTRVHGRQSLQLRRELLSSEDQGTKSRRGNSPGLGSQRAYSSV